MVRQQGFTLIELSIVLVIIGLIVGGVLVGQELIRQAEMRAAVSDIEKIRTAVNTFRGKYDCLPGDCINAYQFFGADCGANGVNGDNAMVEPGGSDSNGCNGDGDGVIDYTLDGLDGEDLKAWQHLALAGLVLGKYTSVADASGNAPPGTVVPPGRRNGTVYIFAAAGGPGGAWPPNIWGNTGNFIQWSAYNPNVNTGAFLRGVGLGFMSGQEAWMFDNKFDDGSPAGGSILAGGGDKMAVGQWNCASTWYVSGPSSGTYMSTDNSDLDCIIYFRLGI